MTYTILITFGLIQNDAAYFSRASPAACIALALLLAFADGVAKLAPMSAPHSHSTDNNVTNAAPRAWQIGIVSGVTLTLALTLLYGIWKMGRPVALPNVTHEKLECASYTPSHNGRMLDSGKRHDIIVSDLKLLAGQFHCVRTYSVSEGLDEVPHIARELGLKVLLGLWISADMPSNDREIEQGIKLANEYADVVSAVIVGNEVLLRRELTAAQLRALIERVRGATQVPVTYADVWEFWLRNSDLATVAHFVTIHILPYWEDHPIDIDRALDHVQSIYRKVQTAFPGKQVVIGETGWPSAGRPRLNAVPSVINEARFVREFVAFAEREKIPYNLIEAFDQPWKRNQEGTVGGYWGLFDSQGAAKFAWTGPIIAYPEWRQFASVSIIGALLFAVLAWLLRPRPSLQGFALMAMTGHAAGSLAVMQWSYLSAGNRSALEWTATGLWSFVGWVCISAVTMVLVRWLDGHTPPQPTGIAELLRGLGHGSAKASPLSRLLGIARVLFLAGVAYVCLGLSYDGRGRDFPIALALYPIVAFALLELIAPAARKQEIDREESWLAFILIATAAWIAYKETFLNTRAMAWCGLCALFAATIAFGQWRSLYPNQRSKQNSDAAQLERV